MVRALSSPMERMSNRCRNRKMRRAGIRMAAAAGHTLSAVIAARLPMVQNSMAARSPSGSATVFSTINPASAAEEMMTPAKI